MTAEEMVEKFLCPGCIAGSGIDCGYYKVPKGFNGCTSHSLGTRIIPGVGLIALGMPKGFNRPGMFIDSPKEGWQQPHYMTIRLYPEGEKGTGYDDFNIPVWALEEDGFLFVRVVQPRLGIMCVDVFEGGKAQDICPQAINMTGRTEEYD